MATNCGWQARGTKQLLLLAIAAVASHPAATWLLKHEQLGYPIRLFFAFLPALVWAFFILAFIKVVGRRADELQRRIHLEVASTAFVRTVILLLIFSGLASAGIYHRPMKEMASDSMVLWTVALLFFMWRYR